MFKALSPGSLDSVIQHLKEVREHVKWLKALNRFLMVTVGFVCAYGIWDAYCLSRPMDMDFPTVPQTATIQPSLPDVREEPMVLSRNIFIPFQTQNEIAKETSLSIQDLKAKYRIVGIILDDEPQVMIENQANQETSFLKSGDKIEEAYVEMIQSHSITLRLRGQAFEIQS